jgi:hypothetical protein
MDGISDTLITAAVRLIVGGPVAYVIGLAHSRSQRIEERRAEVIAELFRHLYIVHDPFFQWSSLNVAGATSREVIADRHGKHGVAAINTLNDLKLYFYSNEPWLFPSTSAGVKKFLNLAESIVNSYPPNLKDIDFLYTNEGRATSKRMRVDLPVLMGTTRRVSNGSLPAAVVRTRAGMVRNARHKRSRSKIGHPPPRPCRHIAKGSRLVPNRRSAEMLTS